MEEDHDDDIGFEVLADPVHQIEPCIGEAAGDSAVENLDAAAARGELRVELPLESLGEDQGISGNAAAICERIA